MSMNTSPQTDAAREAARREDGRFGNQQHTESNVSLSDATPGANRGWLDESVVDQKADEVLDGPLSRGVANRDRVMDFRSALFTVQDSFPRKVSEAYRRGMGIGVGLLTDRRLGTQTGSHNAELDDRETLYRAELLNTKRTNAADREQWRSITHLISDPDEQRGSLDAALLLSGKDPVGPSGSRITSMGRITQGEPRHHAYTQDERIEILNGLAEGQAPDPVFGPQRPQAAHTLYSWLAGIAPTREERLTAAYGSGPERRVRAYDFGREFFKHAYYDHSHLDLPANQERSS